MFSMIIFHTNLKNTIITVLVSYVLQILLEMPAICIVLLLFPDFDTNTSGGLSLLIMVIYTLLTLLAIHFLPLHILYKKAGKTPSFMIAGGIFAYIIISFVTFFLQHTELSSIVLFIASSLTFSILFVTMCLYFFQAQKKEQAVTYYENYLSILDDMILAIRKTQHNHNNTIQAIAGLSETYSDYDSLAAALENYTLQAAKTTIPAQLLHFENKLLTALLYNKFCLAREHGINMDITVHDYFYMSRLNEFQIVELSGILLDNAIEAVTEKRHILDNPAENKNNGILNSTLENAAESREIIVEIGAAISRKNETSDKNESPFTITVKNPGPEASPEFIRKIFSDGYTSKNKDLENHGLGLAHVKTLTRRYKGEIEVANEMIFDNTLQKDCRYFVICISI